MPSNKNDKPSGPGPLAQAALAVLLFATGLIIGYLKLPPATQLSALVKRANIQAVAVFKNRDAALRLEYKLVKGNSKSEQEWFDKVHPGIKAVNFQSLVSLRNAADIKAMRNSLIKFVWQSTEIPKDRMPDEITTNIRDDRYADIDSLERIDQYSVQMEQNVLSKIYHFVPRVSNGKFVIYHQGHHGDFINGKQFFRVLLDAGYQVLAFSLPLYGMNSGPDLFKTRFGPIRNTGHNAFFRLDSDHFSSLKFFIEPLVAVVNYVEKQFGPHCLAMTGLSGGGWLTTVYAAIDQRICRAYPVAGTMPRYISQFPPNMTTNPHLSAGGAEYEFVVSGFYAIANIPEFMIMAAYGPGRTLIQFFNKYDRCCSRGVAASTYVEDMNEILSRLGAGKFKVYIDKSSTKHAIARPVVNIIMTDLETMN